MTDLDFDELDKAVTSIINKGNKRAAKPVESSESVEPSQPQAVEVGATPPSAAELPESMQLVSVPESTPPPKLAELPVSVQLFSVLWATPGKDT